MLRMHFKNISTRIHRRSLSISDDGGGFPQQFRITYHLHRPPNRRTHSGVASVEARMFFREPPPLLCRWKNKGITAARYLLGSNPYASAQTTTTTRQASLETNYDKHEFSEHFSFLFLKSYRPIRYVPSPCRI